MTKVDEDFNIKNEINYQLAVNGFVRQQTIATKTDFIKPVIQENQTANQYTGLREQKRMLITKPKANVVDQRYSPAKRNSVIDEERLSTFESVNASPPPSSLQNKGKMSVVTQLTAFEDPFIRASLTGGTNK